MKNRCMRKKITIREYRLVFFWAAKPKQSAESILEGLSLKMAEPLSSRRLYVLYFWVAEDFTYRVYWFSKEYCWKNRFSLSCIWSCRIRNLCKKARGTHKNAYRHITVTKFSLRDLFEVLEVSLDMLLRKTSDVLNASRIRPKENPPLAFLASTGGRPAYSNKGNDRASSWDRNELEKYSNKLHALESPSKHYTDMGSSSGWRTISPISRYCYKWADVWNWLRWSIDWHWNWQQCCCARVTDSAYRSPTAGIAK